MRVTFVMPAVVRSPVGGIKVAYEFANGLARRGHHVHLLHLVDERDGMLRRARDGTELAAAHRAPGGWFRLDPRLVAGLIDRREPEKLRAADALIAVGWKSVSFVAQAPPGRGRGYYLAMDYMAPWEGAPGDVDRAWRTPLRKLVTAHWLERKAREVCGDDADVRYVPLGIGGDNRPLVDPAARRATSVLAYFNPAPSKGFGDALAALEIVRREFELTVTVFGASHAAIRLPNWVRFVRRPRSVVPYYNAAAIFLHSSRHEGWGLPPAEAMACGCAVVAAANLGVCEYAVDGRNSLLAPIGDVDGLAAAVQRLITDDALRMRIARQAVADIGAFSWERAVTALEAALSR